MPRANGTVVLEFERAAARGTVELAVRNQIPVVDAFAHMGGHREWFARDFVHFNDEGAATMADLIAKVIAPCVGQPIAAAPGGEAVDAVQ
jgi:lysophospholipase L1-like esterase